MPFWVVKITAAKHGETRYDFAKKACSLVVLRCSCHLEQKSTPKSLSAPNRVAVPFPQVLQATILDMTGPTLTQDHTLHRARKVGSGWLKGSFCLPLEKIRSLESNIIYQRWMFHWPQENPPRWMLQFRKWCITLPAVGFITRCKIHI